MTIPASASAPRQANPGSAPAPEPVLLLIADISGYTRYMTANAKTLSHSQVIITELVEAIIHEVELPLEVAKLEGDAVFLYCRKNAPDHPWSETRRIVGGKLLTFFQKFGAKVAELSQSTTCTCNACTHIEQLRLKVVVHSGEALFHRVHNFLELAGVDVIIVHRLLKNSVAADQYLLLTESAARDLALGESLAFEHATETYEDIGRINTLIYHPEHAGGEPSPPHTAGVAPAEPGMETSIHSSPPGFAEVWHLYWRLWFAPFRKRARAGEAPAAGDAAAPNRASQLGLAILTLALTPFMLPVGLLFVARQARSLRASIPDPSQHPPDCGCDSHS